MENELMEMELAQLVNTMPFLVLNAICFVIAGAAALVVCIAQQSARDDSREQRLLAISARDRNASLQRAA